MNDKLEKRKEKLSQISLEGAQAASEFKLLQGAFLQKRAEIMDEFEAKGSLDTEALQDIHRTYRLLGDLEDFFYEKIRSGEQAFTTLSSIKEPTNERSSRAIER